MPIPVVQRYLSQQRAKDTPRAIGVAITASQGAVVERVFRVVWNRLSSRAVLWADASHVSLQVPGSPVTIGIVVRQVVDGLDVTLTLWIRPGESLG